MTSSLHPSAQIDPAAQLGEGVRVGPNAIIEAGCIIGDGCEIRANAVITGGALLGPRNQIGYGAIIGAEPQDLAYKGAPSRVEIGAENIIREYVTIHRGTAAGSVTRLGDKNFLMAGVHIAHNCLLGSQIIIVNNTLLAGHVQVEDRAFFGGATIVHQHVRIGTLIMTHGGADLKKDVPPYFLACKGSTVAGLNRVGLRRAGISQETRRALQAAFDLIYLSGRNVSQAVQELRAKFHAPEIKHLLEFLEGSKRGICRYRGEVQDEE